MIKRIIPLFLSLTLCFAAIPHANATSTPRRNHITDRSAVDGSYYTTSPALAEELNAIFDGNASLYADRDCTTPVATELGTSPVRNNGVRKYVGAEDGTMIDMGTSCYVYANGVYYTLFGESTQDGVAGENSEKLNITGNRRASYENFKAWGVRQGAGALIRASGHSMILLDYDEHSITYLDGNGDGKGLISVNKETWEKFFYSYVSYIIQPKDQHYADLYRVGTCGEDLFWSVDDAGTLTISGFGSIQYPGWSNFNDRIQKVVIEDGVTGIGNGAFYNCRNLRQVIFNGNAPVLSENAFWGVTATVCYPATKYGWDTHALQNYGGELNWIPIGITPLKIIQQPAAQFDPVSGQTMVSLEAQGDGLTYTWYCKEAGEAVYVKTSSTGSAYCVNAGVGRQVMCVVRDQYGNTLQSESLLLQA